MRHSKIDKIVDKHNQFVSGKIADLMDFKNEIDLRYIFEQVEAFKIACKIQNSDAYDCSKKEIEELIADKTKLTWTYYKNLVCDFESIKKRIKENKRPFDIFFSHFCPGFYKITDIARNKHNYMYIIDMKETFDKDKSINLYGILSTEKESGYITINSKANAVSKMNKWDFSEYLLNRICCCGISNELELVKYVQELTEKFDVWDKSIV